MKTFTAVAVAFLLLLPLSVDAQFGPIVPEICKSCPCGFGGVLAIIQNVVNFIIALSVIVATIIIAWAGGLYMLSATNPESRSMANKMLINAAVGLMIVLSAWLIVDFVMKTLYNNDSEFGPWNTILMGTEGDSCIIAKNPPSLFDGSIFEVPGNTGSGSNCPVPAESTMASFPAEVVQGGSGKATATTVQNFMAMHAAALEDGITLKVTSAYRSDATQVTLWNQYGQDPSKAAKPCSLGGGGSNHNSGKAVDIAVGCSNGQSGCDTATYRWLKANGSNWGFRNSLPNDPVHWSPSGN